eukprot:gene2626-3255_t
MPTPTYLQVQGGQITIIGSFLNTKRADNTNTTISMTICSQFTNPRNVDAENTGDKLVFDYPAVSKRCRDPIPYFSIDELDYKGQMNISYFAPVIVSHSQDGNIHTFVMSNFTQGDVYYGCEYLYPRSTPYTYVESTQTITLDAKNLYNGDRCYLEIESLSGSVKYGPLLFYPYLDKASNVSVLGGKVTLTSQLFGGSVSACVVNGGEYNVPVPPNSKYGSIVIEVLPRSGPSLNIPVYCKNDTYSTNAVTFNYGPEISHFYHSVQLITVNGNNFVDDKSTYIELQQEPKPSSWSYPKIITLNPSIIISATVVFNNVSANLVNGPFKLFSSGVASPYYQMKFNPFIRSAVTYLTENGTNILVVFQGDHLGLKSGSGEMIPYILKLNQIDCINVKNLIDNQHIQCVIPIAGLSSKKQSATIQIDELPKSTSVVPFLFSMTQPSINNITETDNGFIISGVNMGSSVSTSSGILNQPTIQLSEGLNITQFCKFKIQESSIECSLKSGQSFIDIKNQNEKVSVTAHGYSASYTHSFRPRLSSSSSPIYPTGDQVITLNGLFFQDQDVQRLVVVDLKQETGLCDIISLTSSTIQCTLPQKFLSTETTIRVVVNNQFSNTLSNQFTVLPPTLKNVTYLSNVSKLLIQGENLTPSAQIKISDQSLQCEQQPSSSNLLCTLPSCPQCISQCNTLVYDDSINRLAFNYFTNPTLNNVQVKCGTALYPGVESGFSLDFYFNISINCNSIFDKINQSDVRSSLNVLITNNNNNNYPCTGLELLNNNLYRCKTEMISDPLISIQIQVYQSLNNTLYSNIVQLSKNNRPSSDSDCVVDTTTTSTTTTSTSTTTTTTTTSSSTPSPSATATPTPSPTPITDDSKTTNGGNNILSSVNYLILIFVTVLSVLLI